MNNIKTDLLQEQPFSMNVQNRFENISANTQASVFLQREIEITTSMFTGGKQITGELVTRFTHDQMDTFLCASFSTISCLRSATTRYLVKKGKSRDLIRADLDELRGPFSHAKMLTLFTGCVSHRSMDGIILNSKNDEKFLSSQTKTISNATDRLVYKKIFSPEGWKIIGPVRDLITKYGVDPANAELVTFDVYHPFWTQNSPNYLTIPEAIRKGHTVVLTIFGNVVSGTSLGGHSAHACLAFESNQNIIKIKNSYFAQKTIEVDLGISDYRSYSQNPRRFLRQNPTFRDDQYLVWQTGRVLQFRDIRTFP